VVKCKWGGASWVSDWTEDEGRKEWVSSKVKGRQEQEQPLVSPVQFSWFRSGQVRLTLTSRGTGSELQVQVQEQRTIA
jgi:hypothetical protein